MKKMTMLFQCTKMNPFSVKYTKNLSTSVGKPVKKQSMCTAVYGSFFIVNGAIFFQQNIPANYIVDL